MLARLHGRPSTRTRSYPAVAGPVFALSLASLGGGASDRRSARLRQRDAAGDVGVSSAVHPDAPG